MAAVRELALEQKPVVEPGGAAAFAAFRAGRAGAQAPERTVCVLSGGNIQPAQLAALIDR